MTIKANNLIAIDLKSVISTGAYQQGLGELRNPLTGKYTGGAMYFFNILSRELRNILNATGEFPYVVVCDDRRNEESGLYYRDLICTAKFGGSIYKKDRNPQDADNKQKRIDSEQFVYQFIEDYSIIDSVYSVEGLEADDLLAKLITESTFSKALLLTNDSDMDCLLEGKRVQRTRRASTANSRYYTEADLLNDLGLHPHQVQAYNALSGGHNNLPRIKKVGAKTAIGSQTAIKYLKNGTDLKDVLDYWCEPPVPGAKAIKGFEIFKNNLDVCKLPVIEGIPDFEGYNLTSIPTMEEVGAFFTNHLGFGYDRSLELVGLFDSFNKHWLSQRPEAPVVC